MKITKRQLKRIIREERSRLLLNEQGLEQYMGPEYADYQYGDPAAAATDISAALESAADVIADSLPLAGDALAPGLKAMVLPTLIDLLAQRGVQVK
jgi:hypothetical protein